jgi:hypothetical protein
VINITGQTFGRLLVLGIHLPHEGKWAKWDCLCSCGEVRTVLGTSLRDGSTLSCGCITVKEMVGERFGRLLVVSRHPAEGTAMWNCICDCGMERTVLGTSLRAGRTRSCGCYIRDAVIARQTTHGESGTPEYMAYRKAQQRCSTDPESEYYKRYAARGIKFSFTSVEEFIADVGRRPSDKYSLDRVDNDRGYEPGNIRWATTDEQMENRGITRRLTVEGETLTVAQWSKRIGIKGDVIRGRIGLGWTARQAIGLDERPATSKGRASNGRFLEGVSHV